MCLIHGTTNAKLRQTNILFPKQPMHGSMHMSPNKKIIQNIILRDRYACLITLIWESSFNLQKCLVHLICILQLLFNSLGTMNKRCYKPIKIFKAKCPGCPQRSIATYMSWKVEQLMYGYCHVSNSIQHLLNV